MTHHTTTRHALDTLLESRRDLWRGRQRPRGSSISSGQDRIDQWLPDGGWPCGKLTELLPSLPACGELALLTPLLAAQSQRQRPSLLANPPLVPCPQSLMHAGVRTEQLLIVRSPECALWAAEQALKSGLCGAVVVWHPPGRVNPRSIRRLALAAEQGEAPLLICYRPGQRPPSALAELRLAIRPGPELLMLRGGQAAPLHLGRTNVIELPRDCPTPAVHRDAPRRPSARIHRLAAHRPTATIEPSLAPWPRRLKPSRPDARRRAPGHG